MSNLLNEAIVDAKALREAALKNAETVVIEKYSEEVRDTLNKLLEQEDDLGLGLPGEEPAVDPAADPAAVDPAAALDPAAGLEAAPADPLAETEAVEGEEITEDEIPLAATDSFTELDGKNLKSFAGEGENVELNINLGALQEAVAALATELDEDEEYEITEEQLKEVLSGEDALDEIAPLAAAGLGAAAGAMMGKRDDEDEEDEDLEEINAPPGPASVVKKMAGFKRDDEDEDLEEGAKPDYLDLDKDGNKKEPMKSAAKDAKKGNDDEELEESDSMDSLVDAIMEKLTVDMGADLAGWAGRPREDKVHEIEKEMARRRSTDVAEELENLKKAHEELVFENNRLAEQNNTYTQALQELKENLQDVNLSNARLLYTNRVLRNPSLNERQKDKIAEAISGAGSVTEAKTIFETLQSTVESTPKRGPKSLSEAIGRNSSVLRATRKEEPSSDPVSDRMKILAGIK